MPLYFYKQDKENILKFLSTKEKEHKKLLKKQILETIFEVCTSQAKSFTISDVKVQLLREKGKFVILEKPDSLSELASLRSLSRWKNLHNWIDKILISLIGVELLQVNQSEIPYRFQLGSKFSKEMTQEAFFAAVAIRKSICQNTSQYNFKFISTSGAEILATQFKQITHKEIFEVFQKIALKGSCFNPVDVLNDLIKNIDTTQSLGLSNENNNGENLRLSEIVHGFRDSTLSTILRQLINDGLLKQKGRGVFEFKELPHLDSARAPVLVKRKASDLQKTSDADLINQNNNNNMVAKPSKEDLQRRYEILEALSQKMSNNNNQNIDNSHLKPTVGSNSNTVEAKNSQTAQNASQDNPSYKGQQQTLFSQTPSRLSLQNNNQNKLSKHLN